LSFLTIAEFVLGPDRFRPEGVLVSVQRSGPTCQRSGGHRRVAGPDGGFRRLRCRVRLANPAV